MSDLNLGIIGGGQLGSLLSIAAKIKYKTIVYSDDKDAPAQFFVRFIFGDYKNKENL